MVESPLARAGVAAGNPLNGREYDTSQGTVSVSGSGPRADDLQDACISPLPTPRDCAALDPEREHCDCFEGVNDGPLCEQEPGVSAPGTTQYWAKAYPGLRELEVLRGYGERTSNSIVTSICALDVTDVNSPLPCGHGRHPRPDEGEPAGARPRLEQRQRRESPRLSGARLRGPHATSSGSRGLARFGRFAELSQSTPWGAAL